MNRQQINYIRECLQIRKRRLEVEYCQEPPKPLKIKKAEQLIEQWRTNAYQERSKAKSLIATKIQQIEEQLILGAIDGDIGSALRELDNWNPLDRIVE